MDQQLHKFLNSRTFSINRQNYTIHLSRSTDFIGVAAIEDFDGSLELINVKELDFNNFEDMIEKIINKYEEDSHITAQH